MMLRIYNRSMHGKISNGILQYMRISKFTLKFAKHDYSSNANRLIDTSRKDDVVCYIRENTEISRDHMTPEIQLHLVTPRCTLWTARQDRILVPDPFWAFYWPGGQALTRYLLDNPDQVRGKRVLDIGSGCGASAIGAALGGAIQVTANDICPVAAEAVKLNAKLNKATIDISTSNLIGQRSDQWDVILLGDMFYDEDFTKLVADWLHVVGRKASLILIGDPGRANFVNQPITQQLTEMAKYELCDQSKLDNNGLNTGYVWRYDKK